MSIDLIRSPVLNELQAVEDMMLTHLHSDIPFVHTVMQHVMNSGGKRIRPLILLLVAKALHYLGQDHIHLAAVVELIHTATLLHDDVVDESTLRRHHESANSRFGNPASVLMGDFLYARAFQRVVDLKNWRILNAFAQATHLMAEGEILQLTHAHQGQTKEPDYFSIIQKKTAQLFSLATEAAALLATTEEHLILALKQYGLSLGLAFQLVDDALDYHPKTDSVGKNIQQDLLEGKMTLPLIYAYQHCLPEQKNIIEQAIKCVDLEQIPLILSMIESTQAIQYTLAAAQGHAEFARQHLLVLPESEAKSALMNLTDFVIERSY